MCISQFQHCMDGTKDPSFSRRRFIQSILRRHKWFQHFTEQMPSTAFLACLTYIYFVVLLCVMLFNLLLMPRILERQIRETDYGTFMTMAEEQNIGRVQVQDNQILFTDKDGTTIYKTGLMYDPGLVERLKNSGAVFSSEIIEETSPLFSILLTWVMPMVVFVVLGQFMTKKLMDRAGGGSGAMSFNMGKSNAKVYVKSSDGIKFSDVSGEDEAKENLAEIVDYLHNPDKYREIGSQCAQSHADTAQCDVQDFLHVH